AFLAKFRRRKRFVEFLRNRDRNGTTPHRNAARENFFLVDEAQVGGARADIHQQGATAEIGIVVTKRVVERHGGNIDNRRAQPRFFDRSVHLVEQIGFDRDQHDLDLLFAASADQLIVPNDFVDRKRHVLLGFEGDDPFDFFLFDGGQFYKPGEYGLGGDRVIDRFVSDLKFGHHFAQRGGSLRPPDPLARGIDQNFAQTIVLQNEAALRLRLKFRQPDRLRPEIEADDAGWFGH